MHRNFCAILVFLFLFVQATYCQDDLSMIAAYKTDTAPTLDGVISDGEWDAAGPAYVVAPETAGTNFDDDPFGGPSDLSFQFRVMWEEPWTAYFLFEINDDIDMEVIPANRWEMDQVEFFMDGNDLEGNDDPLTFQWWDNDETYGKFGASRFEGEFEGNTAAMSTFIEDLYEDGVGAIAAAFAGETGEEANYIVEYAVSLEPMFDNFVFDGTPTGDAEQIVEDETAVKWTVCISDDDNFGDGTLGRSHTICSYRAFDGADWRDSTAFADLMFVGPYGNSVDGDFNGNGNLDVEDIDALTGGMNSGDLQFDLTGDGAVDIADRQAWIKDLKNTWFGDANLDGEFNSSDLVGVFQTGKFETGQDATWNQGDWNGDGVFSSGDFVTAFQDGGFEQGPRPAVATVPEPRGFVLLIPMVALLVGRARRSVA